MTAITLATLKDGAVVFRVVVDETDLDPSVDIQREEGPYSLLSARLVRVLVDVAPGASAFVSVTAKDGRLLVSRELTASLDFQVRGKRANLIDAYQYTVTG